MKKFLLSLTMSMAFIAMSWADCTITTDCVTKTYEGTGIAASFTNDLITVTQNGTVIDTIECTGGFSLSCSGSTDRPKRPKRKPRKPRKPRTPKVPTFDFFTFDKFSF